MNTVDWTVFCIMIYVSGLLKSKLKLWIILINLSFFTFVDISYSKALQAVCRGKLVMDGWYLIIYWLLLSVDLWYTMSYWSNSNFLRFLIQQQLFKFSVFTQPNTIFLKSLCTMYYDSERDWNVKEMDDIIRKFWD